MKIGWDPSAWDDYLYWQATDPVVVTKINDLIKDVRRSPFGRLGKPEPLRGDLSGWWSRRINGEHRLVYRLEGKGDRQIVVIAACRYHY